MEGKLTTYFTVQFWKRKLSGPLPRECKWVQCIYEEFAKYQKQTADQPTKENAIP